MMLWFWRSFSLFGCYVGRGFKEVGVLRLLRKLLWRRKRFYICVFAWGTREKLGNWDCEEWEIWTRKVRCTQMGLRLKTIASFNVNGWNKTNIVYKYLVPAMLRIGVRTPISNLGYVEISYLLVSEMIFLENIQSVSLWKIENLAHVKFPRIQLGWWLLYYIWKVSSLNLWGLG